MSGTHTPKICIRCKQDCSGKPRTKDLQGNYTCRACLDRATGPRASESMHRQSSAAGASGLRGGDPERLAPRHGVPSPARAARDENANFLADLLDSGQEPDLPIEETCPSCTSPMAADALVCMTCGYNKQTAVVPAVTVERSRRQPSVAGSLAGAAAGAVASSATILIGTLLGAIVAGAIGAGVWAAIAYNTGYEVGFIAWGIGAVVGIGAAAGSRGHTGLATGGIAVIVAICAILAGKYIAVNMYLGDTGLGIREVQVEEENAIAMVARGIASEQESAGRRIAWPRDTNPQYAFFEESFPSTIWNDARGRWERLDESQQAVYYSAAERELRAFRDMIRTDVQTSAFLSSFGILDLIFFGLAIVTALGIGSGGTVGSDDD